MTGTQDRSGSQTGGSRVVRAPRGNTIQCRGWIQEAALRMLMNNLDPEVAERPEDLVVYGGTGRAARSWEAFDQIVASLKQLTDDETLLVQSGKPVGVFQTHPNAPRVLIERCMKLNWSFSPIRAGPVGRRNMVNTNHAVFAATKTTTRARRHASLSVESIWIHCRCCPSRTIRRGCTCRSRG